MIDGSEDILKRLKEGQVPPRLPSIPAIGDIGLPRPGAGNVAPGLPKLIHPKPKKKDK